MKLSAILLILFFVTIICIGCLFVQVMAGHGNGWYILGFFGLLFTAPGLCVYSLDLESKGK